MAAPSDIELVSLVIAAGDRPAFAELTRRHHALVRNLLARLTGNRALADDLAQETFLRAFQKIADYSGKGAFHSWICAIAYREFLKARRKREAAARAMERMAAEDETGPSAGAGWDRGDAVDLDRALARLSEAERTCLVMCYACGMSHADAAEATGMPLGTVKSHVQRGRAKMRELLAVPEKA